MVIHKLYVPPTVSHNAKPPASNLLPPVESPPPVETLPPATAYLPKDGLPIVDEDGPPGEPLVFADDVLLELRPGRISGRRKPLGDGNEYFSFQGIPYAQPPVGELRFRSPVPLESFGEEVLDCSQEGNMCLSAMYIPPDQPGTRAEDCLYLNVYTRTAPGGAPAPLQPVMVWIHGGGFYSGNGNTNFYGPEFLLRHGVVLVTLNYRLGPLGFLALPSVGVHGNAGLKDQQLALKWVKENIDAFGGDPTNVTLFGESAGSASVYWHYLCATSRQYFHKAICQSGSPFCPWGLQEQPEIKARKLASVLGYGGDDDAGVYETLLKASAEDLVDKGAMAFDEADRQLYKFSPFLPVIEDPSSEDAILTQPFEDILKQPNFTSIPMISGFTANEGLLFYALIKPRVDEINGDVSLLLPPDLGFPRTEAPKVYDEVRQFYFKGESLTDDNFMSLLDVVSDVAFAYPICKAAELHSRYQHEAPLFFYRFSYETELNLFRKTLHVPDDIPGVCHGDELSYMFKGSALGDPSHPGSPGDKARTIVCQLWTNFAKYGHPTPPDVAGDFDFRWDPVTPTAEGTPFQLETLELNEETLMVGNPFNNRIAFWRTIAERYAGGN